MGVARPRDFGSAFHNILVFSTLSCLAAKKANRPKEMPKLTTSSDPLPISHRSRSAGGWFLIPLMGRPSDHPPILCQSHFGNFILIFSVATYVRWCPSRQSEKANPPMSKPDKIEKDDAGAKSHYYRPERNALKSSRNRKRTCSGQTTTAQTCL